MRWKLSVVESNMYTCCWCCHVRTGTILFGIVALLGQLAAWSLVAVVTLRPDLVANFDFDEFKIPQPMITGILDDTSSVKESETVRVWWLTRKNWTEDDKFVAVLLAGGCIIATTMLVYGAIKGKAGHMVPFMGLQVFDFCITSLTVISYFSYVPDVKRWINAQDSFPLKDKLMSVEADWLMLGIVLALVGVLVIKAYLIGIVWSCYKYLTQVQQRNLRCSYADQVTVCNLEDSEVLLPPKYEDVPQLPIIAAQAPPPPYSG